MQINKDRQDMKIKRKMSRHLKSQTKYPEKLPTYIVAFAMNENNKNSNVEDLPPNLIEINHVAPTVSSQTLTMNTSEHNIFTMDKEALIETNNECGHVENEVIQGSSNICGTMNLNEAMSQPRVLFNAQRHTQKPKFNAEGSHKKPKKYKRVVKLKNVYFKNKSSGMTRNLKRYCKKAKSNYNSPRQIQKGLYHDTVSKRVSRSPILRKVLAKENLLEETGKLSLTEISTPENREGFFICSPLEGNSSFVSDSSQGTLTRQDSLSSRNEDVTTTNSVIRMNDKKTTPYKSDIINVAVAQINNTPNLSRSSNSIVVPQRGVTDYKGSLTSTETAFSQTLMLTSNYFIDDTTKPCIGNISEPSFADSILSDKTLIPSNKLPAASCGTFEVGKTTSYFHNPTTQSHCDVRYDCGQQLQDFSCGRTDFRIYDKKDNLHRTQQLYDDIINMTLYPKSAPCTSSIPDFPNNDNVIIAKDIHSIQCQLPKITNRGDETHASVQNDFPANIFQKPVHTENAVDHLKNRNIPNTTQLESNMNNPSQRKCSEEARDTYINSFPELFDKLTIILEIAVKKLEKTLSDKIENELKKSFHEFEKRVHPIPKFDVDESEYLSTGIQSNVVKSNATILIKPTTNTSLQCDIEKNEVIDKLMNDFSNEAPTSGVQSSSSNFTHKLKKPKLVKDYFEVLKAPIACHYKEEEEGKGDSVQISVEDAVDQRIPSFDCTKTFISIPVTFVRENMFVLASVPAFLFVLFVIYSYVLLILRMW